MPEPLVLPEGAQIAIGGSSIAIRHTGDVVVEQTLGRRLARVESDGDVTLRIPGATGSVRAGGTVRIEGDAELEDVRGAVIHVGAVRLQARALVATEAVHVDAAVLEIDVIISPEIHVHGDASGRVRVIDTRSTLGRTKVRGLQSLLEYERENGDVAEFLARRGVEPLDGLPELEPEVEVEPLDDGEPEEAATDRHAALSAIPTARDDAPEAARTQPMVAPESPRRRAAPPRPTDEAPSRPRAGSRLARQVQRAWSRLQAAYPDDTAPRAVVELGELVAAGRLEEVPEGIDVFWREALREHLSRGTRPPRAAILAFHGIRAVAGRSG
ncbi:MAG: hypothetical protein H6732_16055 [Alphaproteobacteria bacterium]|nr:hypothetical protein [Alphaproteobacteria bacterium]